MENLDSRKAFNELVGLLQDLDTRYLGPEWGLGTAEDVAGGFRAVMHVLQGGFVSHFEEDTQHPRFIRIVSPSRKFTGDNADAIYYDAAIDPNIAYRITGNTGGAIYTSLTLEAGTQQGNFGTHTAGVINDENFDVAANGDFEIILGGTPREKNWLALPPDANRVTTRHYFEDESYAACNPNISISLAIAPLKESPPTPPPGDEAVAAGIRRVCNFVRSRTLEMPPPGEREQPPFVSTVPNQFPQPLKPGNFALAAADAAYSMAPYVLGPDQALIIRGRWPECRCANISLWNRHMQTYDFTTRPVSLNRKQTRLDADGNFRMVLAHRDPGVANWLDTEGRPFGLVFWRFMLPSGEIQKPSVEVTAFEDIAGRSEN
ncbi:MAG TPA: DUF1214 domain-containing protein [Myxococcales bacterium]|nr:DUF1214 domain-containing protein [Myxococcales bacterium]HIL01522.1 DUF1214 domain-containing protein [Myxococcales bacterium]